MPPLQGIVLLHVEHESTKKRVGNATSQVFLGDLHIRSDPRVTLSASVEAPGGLVVRDGKIDDLVPAKYIQAHW
jgi:hypothetical protein